MRDDDDWDPDTADIVLRQEVMPMELPRLLVVDDDPSMRGLLERLLGESTTVTSCSAAHEALTLLRGGARYELVVSDLSMPFMNGVELHETIESLDANQAGRMLFVTGDDVRYRSFLKGIPGRWLVKPFGAQQMREWIAAHLQRLPREDRHS